MEHFDLFDNTGQSLNKKVLRGTRLNAEEYHIVVNIWIRNNEGLYLVQQRNKLSDKVPFKWAATAGAVISGDTSLETAVKETHEELGINLDDKKLKFLKRYFVEDNYANFILDVYLTEEEVLLKNLNIDKLEVKDAKYVSMTEIKEQIKEETFVDYEEITEQKGYFDLIEKS